MRVLAAILLLAGMAPATAQDIQHRLTWAVIVQTPHGFKAFKSDESETFPSEQACEAFAKSYSARMEDWTRGMLGTTWAFPVIVGYKCDPAGSRS